MRRLLRIIKFNLAILSGKQDEVYPDLEYKDYLPNEWISDKILDSNICIINAGYSEKHKAYVVITKAMKENKN